MKNLKKSYRFRRNTRPDLLKNYKATNPTKTLGHHRPVSETPLEWRFADVPMMARFKWYLDPQSLIN